MRNMVKVFGACMVDGDARRVAEVVVGLALGEVSVSL
jgi:hypothetical protein